MAKNDRILNFTVQLAKDTGKLLLDRYQQPNLINPELKPDRTVITDADLEADRFITNAIKKQHPDDHILSEELDTTYPGDGRTAWVVDPLDGTANFSLGVHYWGVSIARIEAGWPTTAVLYFPVFDELFTAQRGKGAQLNGSPLHLQYAKNNHPVALFTRDSRAYRNYKISLRIKPRILGSAAYNFCAVAKGISIVGFETIPKIWDIAASWLVLEEAGGALHTFGAPPFPLIPQNNYMNCSFPTIGAAAPELLENAKNNIIPK